MAQELRYLAFKTRMGWMAVLAGSRGLLRTTLPRPTYDEALKQLGDSLKEAARSPDFFANLRERLTAYFDGSPVSFENALDLASGTSFQQAVWHMTRLIPFGETRSYKWVGEAIGHVAAVRAVGQALGRNPLPIIIPCHRVIGSDKRLCGFGGGLEMKKALLNIENPEKF